MKRDAYVYIPDDLREKIPRLYAAENEPNPTAWVKLFTPDSSWTWYVIEWDGEDTCFGYVVGFAAELGYFLLSDISCARGKLGLPIERDLFFQPKSLAEIKASLERTGGFRDPSVLPTLRSLVQSHPARADLAREGPNDQVTSTTMETKPI